MDGDLYPVIISDESEALLAAQAAGRAIIGIWRQQDAVSEGMAACSYLVMDLKDVDEILLDRVVRRLLDKPWIITETKRLLIREFASSDPLEPQSSYDGDGIFSSLDKREAYRKAQYRFCECGLWALVRKEDKRLIGKAGLTGDELGYQIYPEFQGKGYALEACQAVLRYAWEELLLQKVSIYIERDNLRSAALARKLGFLEITDEETSEETNKETGIIQFEKIRG